MNKKLIVVGAALALSLTAKAVSFGGVSAYTSLSSALAAAQSQQKMLFVLTGTSWCPHCTDLKNAISTLASEINANFVVYYCDGDRDKTMPSTGYPHWGIFNPYEFVQGKRWSQVKGTAEYVDNLGFSQLSQLESAIASALRDWASASKDPKAPVDPQPSDPGSQTGGDKKPTTLEAGDLAFYLDMTDFPEELKGNKVLVDFLPTAERPEKAELTSKQKMTTGKAAKISYSKRKGLTVVDKEDNLSGLKLSYNKKKQTFKGSFKIYTQKSSGSLKKLTVKVEDGVFKDGVGTATARITGLKYKWTVTLVIVE